MPAYVVQRATVLGQRPPQSRQRLTYLLLGVTYKADVADQCESPARPLAKRLLELRADLAYHDSHVRM